MPRPTGLRLFLQAAYKAVNALLEGSMTHLNLDIHVHPAKYMEFLKTDPDAASQASGIQHMHMAVGNVSVNLFPDELEEGGDDDEDTDNEETGEETESE